MWGWSPLGQMTEVCVTAVRRATDEAARPLRADAQRNRDAILQAAREAFEADGVLTSLDGIAARAEVGNATLYRHFPTRDDLLAAVIQTSIASALTEGDELARTLAPGAALVEWLRRLTWQLRTWHDLPSCLVSIRDDGTSSVKLACNPLLQRTAVFLEQAQASGEVIGTVTVSDVFELVLALSWGIDRFGNDEAAARRRVTLATAGIFARAMPPGDPV